LAEVEACPGLGNLRCQSQHVKLPGPPAPTDSPSSDYPLVVKVGCATAATLQRALPMSALPNDAREIVDVPPQAPLEAHDDYAQLVYGGVRYQGLG